MPVKDTLIANDLRRAAAILHAEGRIIMARKLLYAANCLESQ
jgi:hypothetical protein